MLPPALGGLRVLRAADPRPSCTWEYVKDHAPQVFPLERRYYTKNPPERSGEILAKFGLRQLCRAKIRHYGC